MGRASGSHPTGGYCRHRLRPRVLLVMVLSWKIWMRKLRGTSSLAMLHDDSDTQRLQGARESALLVVPESGMFGPLRSSPGRTNFLENLIESVLIYTGRSSKCLPRGASIWAREMPYADITYQVSELEAALEHWQRVWRGLDELATRLPMKTSRAA